MARIELQGIAHSYRPDPRGDQDYALRPLELSLADGGAFALLGPSGCGKTTLLNIISGLIRPSHGRLLFDGRDVTGSPTEARNIAQVFQFPVIYDTMTVFDNLAFPLRNRKMAEAEVRRRVQEIAEVLELGAELKYRAAGLSADAKQKISLGRGLVRKDVAAILFDEPLTVIDPHLKWLLRRKLKQIHEQLRLTLVYVTHDQTEALTFADTVLVMYAGQVVQSGAAQDLFETPAHTFVGYFIGSPGMNLLEANVADDRLQVGPLTMQLGPGVGAGLPAGPLKLGVRPEFLRCEPAGSGAAGGFTVPVVGVQDLGSAKLVTVKIGEQTAIARLGREARAPGGQAVISFEPRHTHLFAGEARVAALAQLAGVGA